MKRLLPLALVLAGGAFAGSTLIGGEERVSTEPEGPRAPAPQESAGPVVAYHASAVYVDPNEAPIEDGYLLVRDGKCVGVAAHADALPPFCEVVRVDGVIVPGLVAAAARATGSGGQGDHALGAQRMAIDDFDPWADTTEILRRGITTMYLAPAQSRLIGGRGAVVKSAGDNRILVPEGDLRVNLTPEAWNPPDFFRPPIPPTSENPIRPAARQPASSRAGAMLVLREQKGVAATEGDDPHATALGRYLSGDSPLRVVADSAAEMRGALEIAGDWGRKLVVEGAREVDATAEALASSGSAIVFEVPLFRSTPDLGTNYRAPEAGALEKLGALSGRLALGVGPHGDWRWLLEAASAAVGYGLDERRALAGITSQAAELLGVGDRVGRLTDGFDADFVVLSAGPLSPGASVRRVFVDGASVWNEAELVSSDDAGVVLRAGTVWTGVGAPYTGGAEVLLQDGRVTAVGPRVPHPPGARFVDAGDDAHITPGFIDARSHMGIDNFSTPPQDADLGLLAAASRARDDWQALARSGVTTAVITPRRLSNTGSRTQAAKTSAATAEEAYVADRDLVFFSFSGDRAGLEERVRQSLDRGKKYAARWTKYREERAKWEEEQAGKTAEDRATSEAELRKRLATGAVIEKKEEVEEEASDEVEEEAVVKERDPINGLWEGTIEHEMIPEPVTVNVRLSHEGERVVAVLSAPDEAPGETFEVEGGVWDGQTVRFEVDTEIGQVIVVGEVDAEDHMFVTISLAGFGSVEFEMIRIEYDEGGGPVLAIKKKKKQDDGPQEPSKDWRLEGLRAVLEGRATAVVEANRASEIRTIAKVFGEFELGFELLGGSDAHEVADLLNEKGIGVVVPASLVQREDNRDVVPAARLRQLGVATAFQSGAGIGGRFLPQALALATRFGLGADQALSSATSEAAALLGIDHRVGRLAPGLDGDVVIHSGHPFDLRTQVVQVFVNGHEVPSE